MDKPEEEIQRYQDYEMGGCFPLADGDYVKYEDHAKALSAERTKTNALQHSLDHEMEVKGDFVSKCKALESKLKEVEKRDKRKVFTWHDMQFRIKCAIDNQPRTKGIISRLESKVLSLEAEAKAVRSKTIEECAKVALDYAYQTVEFDEHEWKCEINGTIYFSPRPFGQDIAGAIRALNSGKGEQHG